MFLGQNGGQENKIINDLCKDFYKTKWAFVKSFIYVLELFCFFKDLCDFSENKTNTTQEKSEMNHLLQKYLWK